MTERDHLQHVCRWNTRLSADNRRLRSELRRLSRSNRELVQAHAELGTQLEASDTFLRAALDELTGIAR
jgi:hypothetical protein